MVVVFGLNYSNRKIGLIKEEVISTFLLAAGHQFSANDDATIGKGIFPAPPALVPPRLEERRRNETVTNV